VEDLSTNGIYLSSSFQGLPTGSEQRIGRKGGRVILKKGDWLRISLDVAFHFRYSSHILFMKASGLTKLQELETQVGIII
jgi:hypothetical protein